ncbi:MAG: ABC transporter permease [Ruminococcus sp.]|nr:ABC transporter permease [Ruminococcus sp.]
MGAIYRREISSYFTSPIAYVFLTAFYFTTGVYFCITTLASSTTDMSAFFSGILVILMVLVPLITMRLLSEERRNKTEQSLLTAPIRLTEMVMGKYLAALTLYTIAEAIFIIYALILNYFGDVQWTFVLSNSLCIFLVGAAFIAIGVFYSSITESQIVAFILTFFTLVFIWILDIVAGYVSSTEWLAEFLTSISVYGKYIEFTRGIFNLSTLIYFLTIMFIFNFLTVRVYEKRRWS